MPVNGVLEYLWFRDNDPWWATLLRAVTLIALVVAPAMFFVVRTLTKRIKHASREMKERESDLVSVVQE